MLLYVFCYDQPSRAQAEKMTMRLWGGTAKTVTLEGDRYFESQIWRQQWRQMMKNDNWHKHDYVGMISYKYEQKTGNDMTDIYKASKEQCEHDVIAFYDYDNDLLAHACHVHGNRFRSIWQQLLSPFFSDADINRRDLPAFYCNYWMAKPEWLSRYAAWAQSVMESIDDRHELNTLMFDDSKYCGRMPKDQLMRVCGKQHYTFHPFMFERLPCIYFYLSEASIGRIRHPERAWRIWRPLSNLQIQDVLSSVSHVKTLALFATHSNKDHLDKNVIAYVSELSKCYDAVIVITTQFIVENMNMLPENVSLIKTINSCHDFGLHFRVLHNLDITGIEEIGLFNDSCYVLKPLKDAITRLRNGTDDVLGLTDSHEVTWHLQSYFVIFRGAALPDLIDFVKNALMYPIKMMNKWYVIKNFEIGLSIYMLKHRHRIRALYPVQQVLTAPSRLNSLGTNTSYTCWDRLLALGFPLLKKSRKTYENEYNFIRDHTQL